MADSANQLLVAFVSNDYVKSIVIFMFFIVMAYVLLSVLKTILGAITRRSKNRLVDMIVQKLETPASLLIAAIGLKFAILPLEFDATIELVLNHAINSLIIFMTSYMMIRAIAVLVDWTSNKVSSHETHHAKTFFPIVRRFTNVFIGLLGFLFIMLEWEVEVGPFLASLGLLGLAVSLALKDSLSNVFGGISLVLDKNFGVGDILKLETGETGEVIDIGMRSTKIRTKNNEIIIMPNTLLANMRITNLTKPDPTIRVEASFGVEYSSDPERVKAILIETIQNIEGVIQHPAPTVKFTKMADYYLEFKAHYWIENYLGTHEEVEDKVITNVWYALKKAKIKIPFPTRTLFMEKAKEPEHAMHHVAQHLRPK